MQEETSKGEEVLQATLGNDDSKSSDSLKKKEETKMVSEVGVKDKEEAKLDAGVLASPSEKVSVDAPVNGKPYHRRSDDNRRRNWYFWEEKNGKLSAEEKTKFIEELVRDKFKLMQVLDDIKAFIPPESKITEAERRIREYNIRRPILNVLSKLKLIAKFLENEQL